MSGSIALILHAHLPFVRHPEHETFLEENWLFEAITESYIPLLAMMQRLVRDGVPFRLTMSLTPTLCAMLQDALLRERYVRHLEGAISFTEQEIDRNRNNHELRELAQFYLDAFTECRRFFVEEWRCDLLAAFRELQTAGVLEIIACAATHGYLPLLQNPRPQIEIGRDEYRETFGREPVGIWLPECGYAPGISAALQRANLRWFVLDTHGLMFGKPAPQRAIYAPCYTRAGPAAFARDADSSRQVWSAEKGYPGDPAYRDFYRDAGFDLPLGYLRRFLPGYTNRQFTGLKYHRVTGGSGEKEIYNRAWAEAAADSHAQHFLEQLRAQTRQLRELGFDPIIVAPFDAELFGHWWFEGPRFLELFIRKAASAQDDFRLTTPTEFLAEHPTQQVVEPASSSWGHGGYSEVWLNDKTAWIYPHLLGAARQMARVAAAHSSAATAQQERVLRQLARELLLAQSSDWAFLIRSGTASEYATQRTRTHLLRFQRLHQQLLAGNIDDAFLADCEWRDNLFANVNWRHYVEAS